MTPIDWLDATFNLRKLQYGWSIAKHNKTGMPANVWQEFGKRDSTLKMNPGHA